MSICSSAVQRYVLLLWWTWSWASKYHHQGRVSNVSWQQMEKVARKTFTYSYTVVFSIMVESHIVSMSTMSTLHPNQELRSQASSSSMHSSCSIPHFSLCAVVGLFSHLLKCVTVNLVVLSCLNLLHFKNIKAPISNI